MILYYDLHIHTNESDGKYSKLEILRYTNKKNINVVAFCDHNVCGNVNSKKIITEYEKEYNEKLNTLIIPAVEIDADNKIYRRIHILGYGIKKAELISKKLMEFQISNVEATKKQIELINKLYGTKISEELVKKLEGTENISSQGLKLALINLGIAKDIKDTFKFVSHKSPTHVDRKKIQDIGAIELIKKAGGVAILAHPIEICRKDTGEKIGYNQAYEQYLRYLISYGLDGVESHTMKHNDDERQKYFEINNKFHILSTAGTDFHDEIRTPKLGIDFEPKRFLFPLLDKIVIQNNQIIERESNQDEER